VVHANHVGAVDCGKPSAPAHHRRTQNVENVLGGTTRETSK